MIQKGKVILVGAGPGDPDLLTVKAASAIRDADVIIYDRLVSKDILAKANHLATKISVGKQPRNHVVPQEAINELLVEYAQKVDLVVRLKGGDPFIFGRGFEEAMHLAAAGIPHEVVPGITAAQGCATSLNFPLTHRGVASSVRYITGHFRQDLPLDLNWEGLTDEDTTLVVYMGLSEIRRISRKLIYSGMDPQMPVVAVSNTTSRKERYVRTDIENVADAVSQQGLQSPVLFVIGRVVALQSQVCLPMTQLLSALVSEQAGKAPCHQEHITF